MKKTDPEDVIISVTVPLSISADKRKSLKRKLDNAMKFVNAIPCQEGFSHKVVTYYYEILED